jgi:hypothetical protein
MKNAKGHAETPRPRLSHAHSQDSSCCHDDVASSQLSRWPPVAEMLPWAPRACRRRHWCCRPPLACICGCVLRLCGSLVPCGVCWGLCGCCRVLRGCGLGLCGCCRVLCGCSWTLWQPISKHHNPSMEVVVVVAGPGQEVPVFMAVEAVAPRHCCCCWRLLEGLQRRLARHCCCRRRLLRGPSGTAKFSQGLQPPAHLARSGEKP